MSFEVFGTLVYLQIPIGGVQNLVGSYRLDYTSLEMLYLEKDSCNWPFFWHDASVVETSTSSETPARCIRVGNLDNFVCTSCYISNLGWPTTAY